MRVTSHRARMDVPIAALVILGAAVFASVTVWATHRTNVAHAQTNLVACNLGGEVDFSSALTFTNQAETVTGKNGTVNHCQDDSGMTPTVVTGSITSGNGSGIASCTLSQGTGSITITWTLSDNSTATSTLTLTDPVGSPLVGATITGTVASGRFAGKNVTITVQTVTPIPQTESCGGNPAPSDFQITGQVVISQA